MSIPRIVRGQSVDGAKAKRARQLRQEMTAEEELLWECLRKNRLNGLHFRRQQVLHGFIADFYCHRAKLIVEIDGSVHDHRQKYDAERDRILDSFGFDTLRFTNQQVRHELDGVLKMIVEVSLKRLTEDLP
ncbi:endonuclease domain-containing protein [Zavarzinella formosa]|uniref:endonuclease domain-containing protein n=1 Tax=Zavarzinella formosa TaxID=360055 RepID=UPI0002D98013|nr:DUF559 domain-containing protein [Zavarzinella formosa]